MHPDWWTQGNTGDESPWLRIPHAERNLADGDEELIALQLDHEGTEIGPSWQVGHTLYTLVGHDAATGTRTLYALRASGTVQRLLESVPPAHLYGAWLLLTSPAAPSEPLCQLAFEHLLEESYAAPDPQETLDDIERRRCLQARDLNAWAREQGIIPATTPATSVPDVPDSPTLQSPVQEQAALRQWLRALEDELDLPAAPEPSEPHPTDPGLEEAFDPGPPAGTGWLPPPLTRAGDLADEGGPDTAPLAPRPHGHRGDDDLDRALLRAEWEMRQADLRAGAATSTPGMLRVDALFGRGPQYTALTRGTERLASAAALMRCAHEAEVERADSVRAAARHRQEARALESWALLPWWSVIVRGQWPPAHRCRLRGRAQTERARSVALERRALTCGESRGSYLARARRVAPGSRDPVGDVERLQEVLPRLREEAVAVDCLSVQERFDALQDEARSARNLWRWHWFGTWHIRRELRERHRAAASGPVPAVEDFEAPAVEDLRYCERPPRPGPGSAAAPDNGNPG
ncbi:hypothetical protein PUR61_08395 [Streptomyces sp. BE20]|uniref:hypothetical protein n=1 Tax=Streptomyces sp. BE20 TaxID=3002525 RepID=UPI002E78DE64|nr:hypothetical protein [Streptomyces sp. BE20]MEE1822214.1 hypothetical protein [Streptomyces sp. BE20]